MRLQKLGHACVRLTRDGATLVVDPGSLTEPDALAGADAVLVTHEHPDHLDPARLAAALEADPDLEIWTNPAVSQQLGEAGGVLTRRVHAVAEGDSFVAAGFDVQVYGEQHAVIHPDLPVVANVGFLVDGEVFHPGDAFTVPPVPVGTLLVPTNAPWLKAAEMIDYVRAVRPRRAYSIHDGLVNEHGLALVDNFLARLAADLDADVRRLPPGDGVEVGLTGRDVLADVVGFLRCPVCAGPLALASAELACPQRHAFDVARQGYVSLLAGRAPVTGDTAAMVQARERFLAAGHFAPLAEALATAAVAAARQSAVAAARQAAVTAAATRSPAGDRGCVLDLGAGTGYYLAAVLDRLPDLSGVALDASRYALRRAARAHPRVGAVAADAWQPLPVRDAAAELALSVFAPRNAAELRRVLRRDGSLLVLTPTSRHLAELVDVLGLLRVDEHKSARLAEQLSPHFALVDQQEHELTMSLGHEHVRTLAGMGPSAFHTDQDELRRRVAELPPPVRVTASVVLARYR